MIISEIFSGLLIFLVSSIITFVYLFAKRSGKQEEQIERDLETLNVVEEAVQLHNEVNSQDIASIRKFMADKYTRDK